MRKCQNCGRQLRTGRKWCYQCKSIGARKRNESRGNNYLCHNCNHHWKTFISKGKPDFCPKCKSKNIRVDGKNFYIGLSTVILIIYFFIFQKQPITTYLYLDLFLLAIILFFIFYFFDKFDKKFIEKRFYKSQRK